MINKLFQDVKNYYKLFFLLIFSILGKSSYSSKQVNYLKCLNSLELGDKKIVNSKTLKKICEKSLVLPSCVFSKKLNIPHFDRAGGLGSNQKKVLVFSTFHGDEPESLDFALRWIKKLMNHPQSSKEFTWRFVPLVNPMGLIRKTRTNGRGVDLNRNFPTNNWNKEALSYWKKKQKS